MKFLAAVFAGLGVLLAVLGRAMEKVGPNPWFGFRTPHTLASERVWRAVNRRSGRAFSAIGAGCLLGALLLWLRPSKESLLALTAYLVGSLLLTTAYFWVEAWRLYKAERAETEAPAVEEAVLPPKSLWAYVPPQLEALPVAILALAFVLTGLIYPSLPARIPTHFGPSGRPDSWAGKGFLSVFGVPLLMAFLYALLTAVSGAMAKVAPGAAFRAVSPEAVEAYRAATVRALFAIKVALLAFFGRLHWEAMEVALGRRRALTVWPELALTFAVVFGAAIWAWARKGRPAG